MYYKIFIIITYSRNEIMVYVKQKNSKENQRFLFFSVRSKKEEIHKQREKKQT